MRTERVLASLAVALGVIFVIQLAVRLGQKPGVRAIASWRNSPNSVEEARGLANQIVLGRVVNVRRANDLVMRAPGEPGNEDRIPVEVITIRLERAYRGESPQTIEVFHTGLSRGNSPAERREPPGPPPPRPTGGVERRVVRPSLAESRTFILEDDPPYIQGERVVIFLTDGPTITVAGVRIRTKRAISPEGRFTVGPDNRLRPATSRKFAGRFAGRDLAELEREIQR